MKWKKKQFLVYQKMYERVSLIFRYCFWNYLISAV